MPTGSRSRKGCFLVLLTMVLLAAPFAAPASAADMPLGAQSALTNILNQERFQPRTLSENWWSRAKTAARDWAMAKVGQGLDALQQLSRRLAEGASFPGSRLLRGILDFFQTVLEWIGKCLGAAFQALSLIAVLVLLAAAAGAIWLLRRRITAKVAHVNPDGDSGLGKNSLSPHELLRAGLHLQALAALRAVLRRQLEVRFDKGRGTTDREFLRCLSESDEAHKRFAAVFTLFEKAAFAGFEIDRQVVAVLMDGFSHGGLS